MAGDSEPMWEWLAKIAGIQQGSGIVGKLCSAALLAFGAMAVAAFSIASGGWTAAAGLAAVLIIAVTFLVFVSKALDHAKNDRVGAGMESAHFLQYELEIAQRGQAASVPAANVAPVDLQAAPLELEPPQLGQPTVVEIVKEPAQ